jgi:hypothetical protein
LEKLKKLIAIVLLIVLLFNIVGYKFVANYFELKATRDLQSLLDQNNYSDADLISFKFQSSLPYHLNSKEFESMNGNIDINGVNYQYVKKRFYNDSLEILCIPNIVNSSIKNTQNDFAKQFIENTNSSQTKKSPYNQLVKTSLSDFTIEHHFDIYNQNYISKLKHDSYHIIDLSFDFLHSLDQPPEAKI